MDKFELLDILNPQISHLNDLKSFVKFLGINLNLIENNLTKDILKDGKLQISINHYKDETWGSLYVDWGNYHSGDIIKYDIEEIKNYKRTKLIDKILNK